MRRVDWYALIAGLVGAAASGGFIFAAVSANTPEPRPYIAIDGDTIEVGPNKDRIRLTTIDAPEMPGHCRPGRICAQGDPYAAQRKLQSLLTGDLYCPGWKRDYYGRKLSDCYVQFSDGTQDIPQAMLASGLVGIYRYDPKPK